MHPRNTVKSTFFYFKFGTSSPQKTSLSEHLLRTIECRNLAAQHDARKNYIQSSTEKKCHNLQVDFVVSKMSRSTSHLNKVYLRKKRSFSASHVSIMSYYVVTTYHDVVTGLQMTLTAGIASSWKVIFCLDFHIVPLLPILLFFPDRIFSYFYFYQFLLKVVAFFKYMWMF